MYPSPRFRDLRRKPAHFHHLIPIPFSSQVQFQALTSVCRIGLTDTIASIQPVRFWQEIGAAAEFGVTMEALQCRNVAVWAMAGKSAAGEVQGRAGRITMSRNGAQGVGHVNHSSLLPSRDWRVYASKTGPSGGHRGEDSTSTGLYATVEKAENTKNGSQRFGSSEVYCDEGSSFVAVETVLENEGGKSVEDYKLRAHIFSESDVFFTALKDRNNGVAK